MSGVKDVEVLQLVVNLTVVFHALHFKQWKAAKSEPEETSAWGVSGYSCVLGSLHSLQCCCGVQSMK